MPYSVALRGSPPLRRRRAGAGIQHAGEASSPSAITSAGAIAPTTVFGTAVLVARGVVTGAGAIAATTAFGTATISHAVKAITGAGGIAATTAFGTARMTSGVASAGAISAATVFGTAALTVSAAITGAGAIAPTTAFGSAIVNAPEPGVSRLRRYRKWVAAVVVAHGVAAPSVRVRLASYGAGVTTPGTPVLDVEVLTEAQLQTAAGYRVKATLTRFSAGTPIPGYYKVISESTGEVTL